MKENSGFKEKFKKSKLYKVVRFVETSATLGLLISIGIFIYETIRNEKETDKVVGNLQQIEQSLSTKYIGIFPDYLTEINKLLPDPNVYQPGKDTARIVIFEDVLFYGAFYNGIEFKRMVITLSQLAQQGRKITIAYYDNENNGGRSGRMFREVIQESWLRQEDLSRLAIDRRNLMMKDSIGFLIADSIVSEEYFQIYREDNPRGFKQRINSVLKPLYMEGNDIVFFQIDSIKNIYLNKKPETITFTDISRTYNNMTNLLKNYFITAGIKLIPLTNYLTMSCWSNGEKVLFAFPGRFAADEIGFISHDKAILHYIDTMLYGIEHY